MFKLGWQMILGLLLWLFCICEAASESSDLGNEGPGIPLPDVPMSLDEFRYAPRFVSIWENRLFELNETKEVKEEVESEYSKPKMILTPSESQMSYLLPQNAPDPLYSKKYGSLVDNFILDSLSTGVLNHEDNRLESPEGHSVNSISGKSLLFKRNLKSHQLTVNGIRVLGIRKTIGPDPVSVFELDGFLFNHRSEISKAFNELSRKVSFNKTEEIATSKLPKMSSKGTTTTTTEPKSETTTRLMPTTRTISTTNDESTTSTLNNTDQPETTLIQKDMTKSPALNTTMLSTSTMSTITANVTSEIPTSTKKPSNTTTENPKKN